MWFVMVHVIREICGMCQISKVNNFYDNFSVRVSFSRFELEPVSLVLGGKQFLFDGVNSHCNLTCLDT